jgi:hypothetical protein
MCEGDLSYCGDLMCGLGETIFDSSYRSNSRSYSCVTSRLMWLLKLPLAL